MEFYPPEKAETHQLKTLGGSRQENDASVRPTPDAQDRTADSNRAADGDENEEEIENPDRPKGFRFAIVYSCILMGDFFVGYDTSCVTTLTPVISDEFNAIDDVGWYGIAYILALASTVLIFGQIYTFYPMKMVFLISFFIFAVGSAISASAPVSAAFIVGRAISGLGCAGIFSGGSIIVANTTSLKHRPIYQGISGGMECTALAFGPLVAGAIAHGTSWRIAFYITIPIAVFNIIVIGIFVRNLPQPEHANFDTKHRFQQLDLLGFVLFVPAVVCLILALQWGGAVYPWSDGRIIALLVVAGVTAIAFGLAQCYKGDKAMFPLQLLKQRSVTLGALSQFCVSGSLFVFGFYLPIYFQAIRGASTLGSGLMYLPSAISFAVAVFAAGYITSFIGYWSPVMAAGTTLLAVGAGLMATFDVHTPAVRWIWYQILYGTGAGLLFQQPYTAVQTLLPQKVVATALVCLSFTQELGGIVALAVSQNVFLNLAVSRLTKIVPGLDPSTIIDQGAVSLPQALPMQYRNQIYDAYTHTIVDVFYIGTALASLTACALAIEWKSVKGNKSEGKNEEGGSAQDSHDGVIEENK